MATDINSNDENQLPDNELTSLVIDYLAKTPGAADRLAAQLTDIVRSTVQSFLKSRESYTEDLVQESVMAIIDYLDRRRAFTGNLTKFTTTVARNRCRNFIIWQKRHHKLPLDPFEPYLTSPRQNSLDILLGNETLELIQLALDQLDELCRNLLSSLYLDDIPVEQIRQRDNLKSVQVVYYRKARCLEKAGEFLKNRLGDCSSSGRDKI